MNSYKTASQFGFSGVDCTLKAGGSAELEQFYPHLPPQVVDEIVKGKQERKEGKAKKAKELAKKRKLKLETELNESVKLEVSEKSPKKKKSRTKKKIKAEAD